MQLQACMNPPQRQLKLGIVESLGFSCFCAMCHVPARACVQVLLALCLVSVRSRMHVPDMTRGNHYRDTDSRTASCLQG